MLIIFVVETYCRSKHIHVLRDKCLLVFLKSPIHQSLLIYSPPYRKKFLLPADVADLIYWLGTNLLAALTLLFFDFYSSGTLSTGRLDELYCFVVWVQK